MGKAQSSRATKKGSARKGPLDGGKTRRSGQQQPPQSVYHYSIWDQLVAQQQQEPTFPYLHAQERSNVPGDVTAFLPTQRTWGKAFEHRPHVLRLWDPPAGPSGARPTEELRFGGATVKDYRGRDILDVAVLPLTISSQVEGWRLEAWFRTDRSLTWEDVIARLRTKLHKGARKPVTTERTLQSRMRRFRQRAGLVCWSARRDMGREREFMDALRSPEEQAQNLTVGRDLTKEEWNQLTFKAVNTRKNLRGTVGATHNARVEALKEGAKLSEVEVEQAGSEQEEDLEEEEGLEEEDENAENVAQVEDEDEEYSEFSGSGDSNEENEENVEHEGNEEIEETEENKQYEEIEENEEIEEAEEREQEPTVDSELEQTVEDHEPEVPAAPRQTRILDDDNATLAATDGFGTQFLGGERWPPTPEIIPYELSEEAEVLRWNLGLDQAIYET